MLITRRRLLATSAAVAVLPKSAIGQTTQTLADPTQTTQTLTAKEGVQQITPEGYPETSIWGYDGSAPGPVIRVKQGARVAREFVNSLSQGSSVHWHGIRIVNDMDGVVGLTQDAVAPGQAKLYDFVVPDAGTYWYHPHNRAWEQMARGLYGALIVDEATPPDVDRDDIFLIDDWRLTQTAAIDESFGRAMDWSHGGRIGNWVTINGKPPADHAVKLNQRLRLRLVNVANSRIFELGVEGLEGVVVALDGQPLDEPVAIDQMVIAPAQRMDLIVDVTAPVGGQGALFMRGGAQNVQLARFVVEGTARPARMSTPPALPANPVPTLGALASARRVDMLLEGGAMGQMRAAIVDGEQRDSRSLASIGQYWALNGVAGMPETPLLVAERGETIMIRIINDTAFAHAMHLHGFHFRAIGPDGAQGPLRDTALVEREETVEIAFVADNPGDWLFHCHMLEHTAAGMLTWIKVT